MLVYVICYGAAMLFAFSAHFTLSGMSLMFAALLSVGIWEKRQSASSPRTVFIVLCGRRRNLLPEAVKPSEGLEFRDLGVLFCSFCSILECVRTGRKEIWMWERKKDCSWFFSEVYREGCREIRDKNFHCTYRADNPVPDCLSV